MGVIACDRSGCPNVMCDRYVGGQRICNRCYADLMRIKGEWPVRMTKHELAVRLSEFFSSDPIDDIVDVEEELKKITKDR